MKHDFLAALLVLVFGAVAIGSGCSKEQEVSQQDAAKYAAKVDTWTLKREDLTALVESFPEHQKSKYSTYEGKVELTERFIQEEVFYREALRKGIDKDEGIRDQIEKYERSLLANEYFNREIKPKAFPSEEEILDYYEANKEKFTKQPLARAQHILSSDSLKLVGLKKRVEKGELFTTLAHEYSEDELTRPDGGNLGFFNPGGYMRGVGYSEGLSEAAFKMKTGDMSIVKWDRGYSLIVLNELRPAEVQPLEEVREIIKEQLTKGELENAVQAAFTELRKKYDVHNFIADEMRMTERTPEELWNLAQNSTDSQQRLAYYEQIVSKYGDSEYAPEALFMVGFVYAEEIQSAPDADRAFRRVLSEYPNSEVAKTAEWMLNNMGDPLPEFDDLEDLQRQIDEKTE